MLIAAAVLALQAAAAPRPGLDDLAYTLGEAHAIRQRCEGRGDDRWRARMQGVIAAEGADRERRTQLVGRFNAGFAAARAAHPLCDAAAHEALADALARAAPLARGLARSD